MSPEQRGIYISVVVNLLTGVLLYFLLPVYFSKETNLYQNLLLLLLLICVVLTPWIFVHIKKRVVKNRFEKLFDVLGQFNQVHDNLYYLFEEESIKNNIRNRLNQIVFLKKPLVYYHVRYKSFLNWVDIMNILFMKELGKVGFKPIIFIHDFYYAQRDNDSNQLHVISDRRNYKFDLNRQISNLKKIVDKKCQIYSPYTALSSFKFSKRLLINSVYNEFIPIIANKLTSLLKKESTPKTYDIAFDLRHQLSYSFLRAFRSSGPSLILAWEGRKTEWLNMRKFYPKFESDVYAILCSSLKNADGTNLKTRQESDGINLTDTEEDIVSKLPNMEIHSMKVLAKNVLFRDKDINSWSKDHLLEEIPDGIKLFRHKYDISSDKSP